jgi:calcineurin-like phosphoesterase family protein
MINTPLARIWVHSDLQLAQPAQAEDVLTRAVDDMLHLGLPLDAVWCLGDAICHTDEAALDEVAQINQAQLRRLNAPVYYVLGNHEMDLKGSGVHRFPLHERAVHDPQWHIADLEEFFFCAEFGGFLVVFMGDHAAHDGSWWTSHGYANGEAYPHTVDQYDALRRRMAEYSGPVIIASHYALPGGQRPAPLMERLLPLPKNVVLHLHGHAHIGDLVWNKEFPWRRANPITDDERLQYNISALETLRSAGSHSALLELHEDATVSLRIRDHLERTWVEKLF